MGKSDKNGKVGFTSAELWKVTRQPTLLPSPRLGVPRKILEATPPAGKPQRAPLHPEFGVPTLAMARE